MGDRMSTTIAASRGTPTPELRGDASPALARSAAWARRGPLLPALVFTIVMTQLPFVATLVIAFMNWNAYSPDERSFAAFDNFRRVVTDDVIWHAVVVTVQMTVTVVVVSVVLGLAIALLL